MSQHDEIAAKLWPTGRAGHPAERPRHFLQVWTYLGTWPMIFPILYLVVQGHIQTGTVPEKLRPALQLDTSSGRWSFIAFIIFCIALAAKARFSVWREIRIAKDLMAFAAIALLSAIWSDVPKRSLFNALGGAATLILAVYVVRKFTPAAQMQLMILPGFIAVLCSLFAVLLFPAVGIDPDEGGAWRGVFQQKNVLGLVIFFLATPFLHLPIRGVIAKAFRAIYLSLATTLILMSRSKTAWCIAAFYLSLMLVLRLLRRFKRRDSIGLAALLAIASTMTVTCLATNGIAVLQLLGKDPTISQRTIIWTAVWQQIINRPFLGYGFAGFWRGFEGPSTNVILASGWMLAQAQNGYLDLWLQIGFLGIAVFLLIMARVSREAIACFHLSAHDSTDWYIGIILSALLYNLSESFIAEPRHICWFLFVMAIVGLRNTLVLSRSEGPNKRFVCNLEARAAHDRTATRTVSINA